MTNELEPEQPIIERKFLVKIPDDATDAEAEALIQKRSDEEMDRIIDDLGFSDI